MSYIYFQLAVLGYEDIVAPCVGLLEKIQTPVFSVCFVDTMLSIAFLFQLFLSPVSPTSVARMMKTPCKWRTRTLLIPPPAPLIAIHPHGLQKKQIPICILNGENILQSSQIEGARC